MCVADVTQDQLIKDSLWGRKARKLSEGKDVASEMRSTNLVAPPLCSVSSPAQTSSASLPSSPFLQTQIFDIHS
ncbi:hypothetical protein Y032_0089g2308 [Ancylostoma ceylanicum]|uniref:Uncharacterized protein n=1 Tax=Ancylostoma ceylanicum TaxID=53326 RepID=A0A016TMN5_9BILA|nr:hypothetical protein Y032_0089g2308 [Ancylostoma ceylanicum]